MSLPEQSGLRWSIIEGDCREALLNLDAQSVQTCVTSPPYYGLRDYGHDGQIGLEPTPDEYIASLVEVFGAVRRVLRDDGTLWLNLGDSYAATGTTRWPNTTDGYGNGYGKHGAWHGGEKVRPGRSEGIKPKDLIGIPWMAAFALRADGWYLRSDVIWAKSNPMPESVTDRPTRSHEYLFLLTKAPRYLYDADAIKEPATDVGRENGRDGRDEDPRARPPGSRPRTLARVDWTGRGRNKRTVWTASVSRYAGAHFATFPPKLIEPCVLAGSRPGDTVLDPFAGVATTGVVALRHGRSFVGVELGSDYAELARDRLRSDAPLLNVGGEVA